MRAFARIAPLALSLAALACGGKPSGAASGGPGAGGPGAGGRGGRGPMQFPVEVLTVAPRAVEYTLSAVGSVEAFERVQVTARVPGAIERVRFSEGDIVAEGAVLAEIEPERYRVAVRSAKASLEKAQAQRVDAQTGLDRRLKANEQSAGLVREDELDQFRARVRVASADEALAKAALDKAELDLRDAHVRAPYAGVVETRTATTGQYVQPGAVLATLLRREPLLLRFQVPEHEAAHLRPRMAVSFTVRGGLRPLSAIVTHVSNAADPATRLVPVTARVDDAERRQLRPGAFAQVTVPVGTPIQSPVIPQTAVRPSEKGFLAYVVEEGKAKERVLELGLRTATGEVEVREGLSAGDQLVVRGAEALRDGAPVRVAGAPSPAARAEGREGPPAVAPANRPQRGQEGVGR